MPYKNAGGYIYFIQGEGGGPIKIGWSMKPRKRLQAIQTCSPVRLVLLGVIQGSLEAEEEAHERFAHLRGEGEWFSPGEDLLSHIAMAASMTPIMTAKELLEVAKEKHRKEVDYCEARQAAREATLAKEIKGDNLPQQVCDAKMAARERRAMQYAGMVRNYS